MGKGRISSQIISNMIWSGTRDKSVISPTFDAALTLTLTFQIYIFILTTLMPHEKMQISYLFFILIFLTFSFHQYVKRFTFRFI